MFEYLQSLLPDSPPADRIRKGRSSSLTSDRARDSGTASEPRHESALRHRSDRLQRRQDIRSRPERGDEANQLVSAGDEISSPSHGELSHRSTGTDLGRLQLLSRLSQMQETQEGLIHRDNMMLKRLQERDIQVQTLSEQLHQKAKAYDELQSSHLYLQQKVDEIQERAFRSMNRSGSASQSDEKTRGDILRLQNKVKVWAKKASASDNQQIESLSFDQRHEIVTELSGYCVQEEWGQLMQVLTPVFRKRFPVLLVQAMLSKSIFHSIFENPFYILDTQKPPKYPASSQLLNLYQGLIETDTAEAHIWRSQLLRLFQTSEECSKQDVLFAEGLQGSLSRIAVQLTENFLKGPARYLLLDLSNENEPLTKNALEDIFSSAARLALSLWTQKSYLKCLDLRDFSLFSNGRDEIGAHALHHLDDDDDTRLNGQQVLLIVQPALIAFGNDDAEHYEQHKVWAKAMVLVDERS